MLVVAALGALLVPWLVGAALGLDDAARHDVGNVVLLSGCGFLWVVGCGVARPASARLRPLRGVRAALLGYLATLVVWVPFTGLAYPWLLQVLGVELPAQPHLQWFLGDGVHDARLPLVVVVICGLGPWAEEVLFRGYLRDVVRAVAGPGAGLWLTAALFGLLHGVVYAPPLFVLGVLFGWLRERTGSLFAPVLAHALHNGLTVVVALSAPEVVGGMYR